MRRTNVMLALASAVVGGLAVVFAFTSFDPATTAKSARLDGSDTETAFLPERFGVPSSQQ